MKQAVLRASSCASSGALYYRVLFGVRCDDKVMRIRETWLTKSLSTTRRRSACTPTLLNAGRPCRKFLLRSDPAEFDLNSTPRWQLMSDRSSLPILLVLYRAESPVCEPRAGVGRLSGLRRETTAASSRLYRLRPVSLINTRDRQPATGLKPKSAPCASSSPTASIATPIIGRRSSPYVVTPCSHLIDAFRWTPSRLPTLSGDFAAFQIAWDAALDCRRASTEIAMPPKPVSSGRAHVAHRRRDFKARSVSSMTSPELLVLLRRRNRPFASTASRRSREAYRISASGTSISTAEISPKCRTLIPSVSARTTPARSGERKTVFLDFYSSSWYYPRHEHRENFVMHPGSLLSEPQKARYHKLFFAISCRTLQRPIRLSSLMPLYICPARCAIILGIAGCPCAGGIRIHAIRTWQLV